VRVSSCKFECAKVNTNASESGGPASGVRQIRFPEVLRVEERRFPTSPSPKGRSPAEDRPVLQQRPKRITVRRRHGSTHRRKLREPDGISCSRISVNQVTITNDACLKRLKPSAAGDDNKLHGIATCQTCRRVAKVSLAVAGRAALSRRSLAVYDESGKGGNAATPRGDFIDRTIDGTRVSAVRLLPRQRVGGKADEGTAKLSASRRRVTSPCFPRNCHRIARHEPSSLAACFFSRDLSIQHTSPDILRKTLLRCLGNV